MMDASTLKKCLVVLTKNVYFCGASSSDIPPKPQGTVVAMDKTSVAKGSMANFIKTMMNKLKWPLLVASATASLGLMGAAKASSGLPAVAYVNGWVGAAADYLHDNRGSGTRGSSGAGGIGEAGIDFPLTHDFALQFHGYDGAAGGRNLQSIDGILFWRNPALGLLGPHAMYTKSGTFHHGLFGLHGEYYFSNWTLTGEGGGVSRSDDSSTGYGEAIVSWYAVPDWRIYLGGIVIDDNVGGELGTEYQMCLGALPALSVFADVGAGSHDLSYAFLGLRYYFGGPYKTLIQRHREDMDPPTLDLLVMNQHENNT